MDQTSELEKKLQIEKYNEIIELLLSAGYFRARISNLSQFDKVVGGLCWCITSSGENVDVDLLFQENSSIGQQIALTEAIVVALRKMGCPFSIQPHQIQGGVGGADYLVISKVILWLIKKYFEVKIEKESMLKTYSIYQFNKNYHSIAENVQANATTSGTSSAAAASTLFSSYSNKGVSPFLTDILNEKKINRLYKKKFDRSSNYKIWKNYNKNKSEELLIYSCFFEYGENYGRFGRGKAGEGGGKAGEGGGEFYNSTLSDLSKLDMNELSGFEKQLAKAAKELKREEEEERERALKLTKKLQNEMTNDEENEKKKGEIKNINNLIDKESLNEEYEKYKKRNEEEEEDGEGEGDMKRINKLFNKKINNQKTMKNLKDKISILEEERERNEETKQNLLEKKNQIKENYKSLLNYQSNLTNSIEKLIKIEKEIENNEEKKSVYDKIKKLIQLNEIIKKKIKDNKKNYKKKMKNMLKTKKRLKIKINKKYYDYFDEDELNMIEKKDENEIREKEKKKKELLLRKNKLNEKKLQLLESIKNNNQIATAQMTEEMDEIEKQEEEIEEEEDKLESDEEVSNSEDEGRKDEDEESKIKRKKIILKKKKITEEELEKIKEEKNINKLYAKTVMKYNELKKFISKINQEINEATRTIDDTPSRGELIQYERRFNELYATSASKLAETRKYYEVYNNLMNKYNFIQKEIKLLDSISENFTTAMKSKESKQEFIKQFELIVRGVEDSLARQEIICKQKQETVDAQKNDYQQLVDQQRSYYKAVKDFQDECNKNEWLTAKLQELQRH